MTKNDRKQVGLDALITHSSIRKAATASGIAEKTLRRWHDDPVFAAELTERRREISASLMRSVVNKAESASDVLCEIMNNKTISPFARLQAAQHLLAHAFRAVEINDVLARITALEVAQQEEREDNE